MSRFINWFVGFANMNFKSEREEYNHEDLERNVMVASADIDANNIMSHRVEDISSFVILYSLFGFAAIQGIRNLYREIKFDLKNGM